MEHVFKAFTQIVKLLCGVIYFQDFLHYCRCPWVGHKLFQKILLSVGFLGEKKTCGTYIFDEKITSITN
jgi:hypothetical protein